MGWIRKLQRAGDSWVVTIPHQVMRVWEESRGPVAPEIVVRPVPKLARYVEIELRLPEPTPGKVT